MKVTFEGRTWNELCDEIITFVENSRIVAIGGDHPSPADKKQIVEAAKSAVEAKPVEKPKNKGGRPKGYSPKKNGADASRTTAEKEAAAEKMAKVRAAKTAKPVEELKPKPEQEVSFEDLELPQPEPEPEQLTPTQLAAIRVKTTEELQQAYAGGKHKQVLELLKKHGNGAKSFRELHIEDFVPIRKAIDDGALA